MNPLPFPPEYLFLGVVFTIGVVIVILHVLKSKKEYEAFQNYKPVMYMFYTKWCGHSQKMLPIWNSLIKDRRFTNKLEFKLVNCEKDSESSNLCKKFKIKFLPTIFVQNDIVTKTYYDEGPNLNKLTNFTLKNLVR